MTLDLPATGIIDDLAQAGVILRRDDRGRLEMKGLVTPALRILLVAFKPELIELVELHDREKATHA